MRFRAVVGFTTVVVLLLALGVGSSSAQGQFHGIVFLKRCAPTVNVGGPFTCGYQVQNVIDGGQDTERITGLSDVVHAASGDVPSGNILGALQLIFSSPTVTCTGGSGAGTSTSPYVGATSCLLPFGTNITTNDFSFYTVKASDFGLPNHNLTDTASLNWNNTCTAPNVQGCSTTPQMASAGGASTVQQQNATVTTQIHNATHQVVTAVGTGTTVHDFVTVAGPSGGATPTGNVNVDWFTNGTCSGNPALNSGNVPLVNGQVDVTGFAFTVQDAGMRAFRANYAGDATYPAAVGACEPLVVVDANIQITPQTATNPVSTMHTLTGHVNVNAGQGAGFVNASDGTVISFSLTNSGGATATFQGPASCTTSAGTGSCTVVISSPTMGTTTIHASTNVTVGGVALTRATGDGLPADSPDATKVWNNVRAQISIAPSATNEVGAPHTFTVTLLKDTGTGTFVPAAGEHVTVTLTDSNGAAHTAPTGTCTNAGANTDANGQCTITFTSPSAGKVTGHASATLTFAGNVQVTVQTDGTNGNSGNAVKTFVDANIQITPQTAMNPIGTMHTLTGHVNVNAGDGAGFVNAPAGTVINFSLTNTNGATATFVGPSSCTTNGTIPGSCTVVISSPTTGTTKIHATTTALVGGVSLTRATGDTHAGDSPDATKTWATVRAQISIAPSATNEVRHSHTFTVTLLKDTGNGTFVPAAGEHVTATLTDSNGAAHSAPTGSCTNAGANTDANGQCTITFSSPSAGKVTGHASATITFAGGIQMTVQTDGTNGNSSDAVKTFVDANIQITPATATNPVGTNHTLTGHVNVNAGDGAGFVNAPAGTVITFSLTNAGGASAAFVPAGANTCTTNGTVPGSCTVVISSPTMGTTSIHASTNVTVGGVALTRATGDGLPADSPDATKVWNNVRAQISIAPSATNEVGAPHTFTVTLSKDTGTGTFVPASGERVTVTLTDSNGAAHTAPTGTCTNAGANTDANGQCTITFTSPSAGKVTGHASATLTFAGNVQVTVQTDGTNGNSGDAVKTFVDANIQVTPATAINPIGTNHTLTGHVNVNTGSGAFANAPDGTVITFSLTNGGGASAVFVGPSSCTTVNSSGSCTVVISSPTPGATTIHATTTVSVGGVSLTRSTGDTHAGDSTDAAKTWASAQISIAPSATNEVGASHTFTVTVQKNLGAGLVAAAGVHVDVTLADSNGAVHSTPTGSCTNAGPNTDANGQCTITFTSPSAGKVTGTATAVVPINSASITVSTNGTAPNSGPAVKTFVDANIQISPLTATNPVGSNHTLTGHVNVNDGSGAGFVSAPAGTTILFSLVNSGGASAVFVGPSTCQTVGTTGSCTVVISSPTAGSTTIHASTTVTVGGVSLTRATGDSHPGDSPDAVKTWIFTGPCPTGPLAGVNVGGLTNDLFFFADGRTDANWQSASPGFVGDVTVNGLLASERTSGTFAYAGTISTNDTTLGAWQKIVDANKGQAFAKFSQTALVTSRNNDLNAAFQQINALPVTPGYANRSTASLDGLNFQNGINERIVINVTSGFQVSKQLNIFGDAGDVIILRWDTDQNFANGYQGTVKFQSGGAIVPKGGLTPGNFINVAGDIDSSGGGKTPSPPYPQGPRLTNGTGALIPGAKDFSGGGFFTGYWLTTGAPTRPADATHVLPYGDTSPLSNGIFVGGWYTFTTKFSMTSGTSGVHVCPNPAALRS